LEAGIITGHRCAAVAAKQTRRARQLRSIEGASGNSDLNVSDLPIEVRTRTEQRTEKRRIFIPEALLLYCLGRDHLFFQSNQTRWAVETTAATNQASCHPSRKKFPSAAGGWSGKALLSSTQPGLPAAGAGVVVKLLVHSIASFKVSGAKFRAKMDIFGP
jgi:hypothetical protein